MRFVKTYWCAILLFHSLFSDESQAQNEDNIWMLGCEMPDHNSGINFNFGQADTFTVVRDLCFFLTNASICDTNGQLLYYTNGCSINNRNHDTLFNSQNFNPGWLTNYYQPYGMGLPQGCLIVPRPNHYGQYYLFHESGEIVNVGIFAVAQPLNLSYSLIDMSLDNGLGGIAAGQKNVHAINDTLIYGRITGVKHANGRDWWIITHKSNSNHYIKNLVTPDTILGPYYQQIGRTHNFERFLQQVALSPLGDKFAIELTADTNIVFGNILDLFDFDRCTGAFSNEQHIIVPDSELLANGCSFSPNGRFLYVSTNLNIYQYDTWAANINASVKHVAAWDSFSSPLKTKFLFHQLAPDGKIYISTSEGSNVLHIINSPDSIDTLCNVIQNSFFLPALNNAYMPNAPNYSLGRLQGSPCDTIQWTGLLSANEKRLELTLNPNPNNGNFSLSYSLPQNKSGMLEVFDVNGRKLFSEKLSAWSSFKKIQLQNINEGIYLAVITCGDLRISKKFVLVNAD